MQFSVIYAFCNDSVPEIFSTQEDFKNKNVSEKFTFFRVSASPSLFFKLKFLRVSSVDDAYYNH